jgi:hypothetical protein
MLNCALQKLIQKIMSITSLSTEFGSSIANINSFVTTTNKRKAHEEIEKVVVGLDNDVIEPASSEEASNKRQYSGKVQGVDSSPTDEIGLDFNNNDKHIWFPQAQLSDFTVIYDNCHFHVHKAYLARDSEYFQTLFSADKTLSSQVIPAQQSNGGINNNNTHNGGFTSSQLHSFLRLLYFELIVSDIATATSILPCCLYFNHSAVTLAIDQSKLIADLSKCDQKEFGGFLRFAMQYRFHEQAIDSIMKSLYNRIFKLSLQASNTEVEVKRELLEGSGLCTIRESKVLLALLEHALLKVWSITQEKSTQASTITRQYARIRALEADLAAAQSNSDSD